MDDVAVSEHVHGRSGESTAVDDAGVVALIAEDRVTAICHSRNDADIGMIAGAEEQSRLGVLEYCELTLQGLMQFHASRDKP